MDPLSFATQRKTAAEALKTFAEDEILACDVLAEGYAGTLTTQIVNRVDATVAHYGVAEPAWIAPLRSVAA